MRKIDGAWLRVSPLLIALAVAPITSRTSPAASQSPLGGKSAEEIYRLASPSVVTIQAIQKDGDIALGTAFLALKDGIGVTAWHVVKDATRVKARFVSGEDFEASGIVDKDESRDLALIRIKVFGRPLLHVSSAQPDVGSRAYVIGAPKGLEFTISEGLVSQIRVSSSLEQYQFSSAASPGNSGGPLLNDSGDVVGVVSWQFREGQNLNFAIPGKYVLGLDPSLPTQPWGSVQSMPFPSGEEIATDALDRLLAHALVTQINAIATVNYVSDLYIQKRGGFQAGVPAVLYTNARTVKEEVEKLSGVGSDDPNREAVRSSQIKRLQNLGECIDLEAQAIRLAAASGGWTSEANDLISRSSSAYTAGPTVDSLEVKLFTTSPAITAALPPDALTLAGMMEDSTGFKLGVFSWVSRPMLIASVVRASLAERLGLRSGDEIVSVNGEHFTTRSALKRKLASLSDQRVEIAVSRGGESVTLRSKVPKPEDARGAADPHPLSPSPQQSLPEGSVSVAQEDGSTLVAKEVEPWPGDMVKITLLDGRVLYLPLSKIREVRLSDGLDVTKKVVSDRRRVP